MFQGFKDFIMRGNVIDLAVGVVIGSAFTAIVTAFSDNIINPLINSVGGADFSGLGFNIIPSNDATFMDFGALVTAIINFLLIAAVVYFLIVAPMNKLDEQQKRRKGIDPEAEDPTEQELLTEIRDLLAQGKNPQIKG
ncbi:large conductance mechanosensitive channel [Corynebacterium appendicis CIP 107643]|uniref:Large-conductance mechanosensitive channel n=1 Tax=Corynebacterium appendicis CIP 107643 TaxID=1161099 RepID=A0A1N7JDM5_9CORY|nr:large-conductance mechanosensitive channel protein MscL [Corynebacterium appendicis]WJY60633.1 Large-conductance mechanosensitive channel [Corynebacterium appendicis CIP 107643]SIS47418.1 large conductance mechanosensitive channel [Corynebacterium appendicis CIP 107643]